MQVDHVVYILVIITGSLLAWKLLRSRWPGWKAFPLLLLVIQATNDLGIAPLLFDLSDYEYRDGELYARTYGYEALRAAGLILSCYVMIAGGLISIRLLSNWAGRNENRGIREPCSPCVSSRAWHVSLLFFLIGSAVNLFLIHTLLQGRSVALIAYERAFFTEDRLVESPMYHMLRLLSVLMMVGALGMVLFSDRRPLRIRLGSAATFLALGVAALYGGRQGVITGMICFLLLYREGGGVIRTQRIVYYAFLGSIILGALVYARFNYLFTNGFSDLQPFRVLRVTSVGYCRIDDTAWVLQTIPDRIPYTGLLNALGSVFNFLPSARIPGTNTLYEHVVAHFYGGVNPAGGIGGANYSTAAELYAWGGWLSTIVFGYIIGLFFGILFEWQRRASSNPFLILLVVLISVRVFFFGVHARMPNIMYQAGVYVLVVAAMAALSVPSRRIMPFLLLLSWNLFPVMIWKLFDLDVLRVLVLATVPLLYFWGVQCLRIAGVYSRGRLFQNEDTQWVFGESISRRH